LNVLAKFQITNSKFQTHYYISDTELWVIKYLEFGACYLKFLARLGQKMKSKTLKSYVVAAIWLNNSSLLSVRLMT